MHTLDTTPRAPDARTRRYRKLARQYRALAVRDPLTGLLNRRGLDEAWARATTRREKTAGVLMLDIDSFKIINDTLGHSGGDAVLRAVATYLRSAVRKSDAVCRYAGDAFVVLLPGVNAEDTTRIATRIEQHLHPHADPASALTIPYTLSIGIAVADTTAPHALGKWLHLADQALLKAKRDKEEKRVTV